MPPKSHCLAAYERTRETHLDPEGENRRFLEGDQIF